MALRIKDNVDLKKLEKFGFILSKIDDRYVLPIVTYDITYNGDLFVIVDCDIRIIKTAGKIYYDKEVNAYNHILYDLIQAGLVEKIEE